MNSVSLKNNIVNFFILIITMTQNVIFTQLDDSVTKSITASDAVVFLFLFIKVRTLKDQAVLPETFNKS